MKYLISFLLPFIIQSSGNLYENSIISRDGVVHSMGEYQGKRIIITILPATQTEADSNFLRRIDSIANTYKETATVIAVPSFEDGITEENTQLLSEWYALSFDSGIIIAQAMFTHISSGEQQSELFQWLTQAEKNGHFEEEVKGAGEMYFINEQGDLYGVFGPEAMWSNKILNRMMQGTN